MIKQNKKIKIKEISHLIIIFTVVNHGIGSSAVFVAMSCYIIYSSCYSSTKMSIISKEYEEVLMFLFDQIIQQQ